MKKEKKGERGPALKKKQKQLQTSERKQKGGAKRSVFVSLSLLHFLPSRQKEKNKVKQIFTSITNI